jgi:hypothetical protein
VLTILACALSIGALHAIDEAPESSALLLCVALAILALGLM